MKHTDVPIPERMKHLDRDKRGYPYPVNLLEDASGVKHFTINDEHMRQRLLTERRCAICGDVMGDVMWMPGGPLSALHPQGWYIDTPLHHECMTYAMQVCPYLGMPNFKKVNVAAAIRRVDKGDDTAVYYDPTVIGQKPPFFVVVQTSAVVCQEHEQMPGCVGHIKPVDWTGNPEVWKDGQKLSEEDGLTVMAAYYHQVVKPTLPPENPSEPER